jgi:hypothetical protein
VASATQGATGLSNGAIGGIVGGVVAVVLIVTVAILFYKLKVLKHSQPTGAITAAGFSPEHEEYEMGNSGLKYGVPHDGHTDAELFVPQD